MQMASQRLEYGATIVIALAMMFAVSSVVLAAPGAAPPPPASPDKGANLIRLLLTGPLISVFFASCYAVLIAAFGMAGRSSNLADFTDSCAERMSHGRSLQSLWGLALVFLVVFAAILLIKTKVLALLGIAFLVAGCAIVGAGYAAAAIHLGGQGAKRPGDSHRLDVELPRGLWVLTGASVVPVAGWIVAILAALAGVGAVAEQLVSRRP